ncbi:phosphotriesterase family protein [Pelosinus propionicus]|uniref:Phosphotriesterase-related protein n=1 Tax=Pelosinus propionicus DSM 13327 TaxID=1123291 RepID=A0A1I4ILA0_9FIRM|nr:phosphotriesterase [Pelosinus propionicus]SFL55064.1 phosphotriesterase-related protein [Pelosinus propionicus DSM 13327]
MSQKIMTVCGPIRPDQLGVTSMHEHVLSDCSMFRSRIRRSCFIPRCHSLELEDKLVLENRSALRHNIILSLDNMRLDDQQMMAAEVGEFKDHGGDSIVEVSAPGIRSSPKDLFAIRQIAEHTGVHIVASTGLYAEYTWPAYYRDMSFEQFCAFLFREIDHGVGETGIFPGHIKAAYEMYTKQVEDYLRAAAFVSSETGLSLQVHLGPYLTGDEVRQNILRPLFRGGCIPERTILCHVQLLMGVLSIEQLVNNPGHVPFDISLHRELLDMGFVLSFTPFGFEADDEPLGIAHYPDWYILSGLVALIRMGYAGQIVIGNDVFTKLATRRGGGEGYTRLTDFVLPSLKKCGVSDNDIKKIMVENPARILAF